MTNIIVALLALVAGGVISYVLFSKVITGRKDKIIREAETEAEVIKKDKILQAKEKFLLMRAEHEKIVNEKNTRILQTENKIKQKELQVNQRLEEFQRKQKELSVLRDNLTSQMDLVEKRGDELDKMHRLQVEKLEQISSMSGEEAKNMLMESMKNEAKTQAMSYINEIVDEAKMTANKEAKRIVIQSIQRVATEAAIENSVTVFNIDSDEIKGRIIGREGRNIRALEAATGVATPVAASSALILRPSRPMIRPFISSLSMLNTVTEFSMAASVATRWIDWITIRFASLLAVILASSTISLMYDIA